MINLAEQTTKPYPQHAIADVIALVSREKNVPQRLIKHRSRCRVGASQARHLAMYLSYVVLGRTLVEIGDAFGRDRTTVSYACGQIEDQRDDPIFDAEVSRLENCLEAEEENAHD